MEIDWSSVTLRLNRWAGTDRWPIGVVRSSQAHDHWLDHNAWCIIDGHGSLIADGEQIGLVPGVFIWMRPGGKYDYKQAPGQQLTYHYAHFDLLDEQGKVLKVRELDLPKESLFVPDRRLAQSVMAHVSAVGLLPGPSRARDNAARMLQCLLEELELASRGRADTIPPPEHSQVVQDAIAFLQRHVAEPLSVSMLAERAGYSRSHFTRLFKAVTGQGPGEYLQDLRINRTAAALTADEASIADIALSSGFRHPAFFSRQFRRRMGVSPSQYRKAHLGKR